MKIGVAVKIDVTKLDKTRFFKGEKGTYADLTTFIDVDVEDKYGNNGFISQSLTKEEREAKEQLPIIGNVKVFYKDDKPANEPAKQTQDVDFDDTIPF